MLKALELANFAIVDTLRLDLTPGLNVLTGETGAGKSILVDALALLIGGRAESSWIRQGCDSALIQGIFSGKQVESAARRLVSSGRSTARLNGELVTVTELSEHLRKSVAIHGQHASQTLFNKIEQRNVLDRLLPKEALKRLARYRKTYAEYQALKQSLVDLQDSMRERARRIDILSFQVDEIDAAKLHENELEQLQAEVSSLRFAERIIKHSAKALSFLSEEEVNGSDLLTSAKRELDQAGEYHKALSTLSNELSETLQSIEAISHELRGFLDGFDVQPGRLEQVEDRLAQIETLQRKYGETVRGILAYRNQAVSELKSLKNVESDIETLLAKQTQLYGELEDSAGFLTKSRRQVALALGKDVTGQIRLLGMDKAIFEIDVQETEALTNSGKDSITFLFSANLGENPVALSAVASGGELSRVMLALNVITGSDVKVLVFDEVDAGIGGKTARAVGNLLKHLAKDHQVLVVTHLPQVAAFADAQFFVEKREVKGRTVTRIKRLDDAERELELARMLSGNVTSAALANARELLADTEQHAR